MMKMFERLLLFVSLTAICLTSEAKKTDFKNSVGMRYLNESFAVYDALQKSIHGFAEPGYLEYKSSKAIADHLQEAGFVVEWGVADIPTAFIA